MTLNVHISHVGTETYGKQIRTGTGGGGTATFNLGQKVKDKFTKLSKRGCSMECFTAGFLRVFTEKRQNLDFGWPAVYSPSNPSISEIFLKFSNFLGS